MLNINYIYNFYKNGFENMRVGKTLWRVVFIKVFLIFIVLHYFVYNKSIDSEYTTKEAKADFVYKNLKGE